MDKSDVIPISPMKSPENLHKGKDTNAGGNIGKVSISEFSSALKKQLGVVQY